MTLFKLRKNNCLLLASLAVILTNFTTSGKVLAQSSKKPTWRVCPQKCLKLSTRGWKNKVMPGKPTYLIWMDYPHPNGAIESWSQDHLGEFIKYENGLPRNYGLCKTCQGKLYVGNPTKNLGKKYRIPNPPKTINVEKKRVLGRAWSRKLVNDRPAIIYNWLNAGLPRWGWAIVDRGRVSNAYLLVTTNGTTSKWIKIAPASGGRAEVITMVRRTQ